MAEAYLGIMLINASAGFLLGFVLIQSFNHWGFYFHVLHEYQIYIQSVIKLRHTWSKKELIII